MTVAESSCSTRIVSDGSLTCVGEGEMELKQSSYLECSTANTLLVAYVNNTNQVIVEETKEEIWACQNVILSSGTTS